MLAFHCEVCPHEHFVFDCRKSTIVRLLYRFFDPDKGGIYIGDQNIRDITINSLRKEIAVIPQVYTQ